MKRFFLALLAAISLSAIGCHHNVAGHGCGNAYCDRCGGIGHSQAPPRLPYGAEQQMGPAGPATAAYGYPYYTTRGPRDFLMANPPSIGN